MKPTRRGTRSLLVKLIMALAAVGLFLVGYQWGNQYQFGSAQPPTLSGVMVRPPQPLPEVVLRDSVGEIFGQSELRDHWSLLAFAPLSGAQGHRSIARLVEVYNRLADQHKLRAQVRLLLVSDDSAPQLAREFEQLSPAIAILSGEPAAVDTLRTGVGAGEQPPADELPPIFLIDPQARLVALFPAAQPAADIAADVAALARWPGLMKTSADE